MQEALHGIDLAIIAFYLIGIVALGCWWGLRSRGKGGSEGEGYFLAGHNLRWPMIGLALFATNISTVHLVSLAQEGYTNGLAYGNFEWMASLTLVILAVFFAPFYVRSRVATLPDFLERRYNRACRDWLSVLSMISAIFIHIGFTIYAGAVVLEGLFGIPLMVSIVGVAALTGLYTIAGGLMAVVITESVQTVVLLLGAFILTGISYYRVGGWEGIAATVEPVQLTMLRPAGDASGLPWYAVFLGYPVIGIWYWCTDQTIVQRVLGAKDEHHARLGPLFAGFIKVLPVFIFVLPGLMCAALIKQGKLPDTLDNSEHVYSFMIMNLLPVGLRGIVVAALLAALMSTVSGALNSAATLFAHDIYKRFRPRATDHTLVRVGRIVTFVGMVLAVAWSPFLGRFPTVFQGINAAICYIAPPITVVFVFGVFWKRANARAALATLLCGSSLGLIVFILDFFKLFGWNVPFMMAGFYLALICSVIMVGVSLAIPTPLTAEQQKLVWDSPMAAFKDDHEGSIFSDYRAIALVLLLIMAGLYVIFG
ncbi:sodium:solute symporter [Roseovarius pacificus]|uniref:sodium:solute symporter n=1 Tax=Roseovarius pacificus TaxID=337701 RepID=UPI002A18C963|nr:sodium:solute symporter [Roseovarius pacificus]